MRLRTLTVIGGFVVAATASGGVGVWTTNGPPQYSGTVAVAPDGSVYATCNSALVCKSVNRGAEWQTLDFQAAFTFSASVLAIDSSGAVYVATSGGGEGISVETLFVSQDKGTTWSELLSEDSTTYIQLLVDPFSPGTLYLLDTESVFDGRSSFFLAGRLRRSVDGGAHWTHIDQTLAPTPDRSITVLSSDPRTPGRLYAATVSVAQGSSPTPALFVSADGGSTWTLSTANLPEPFVTLVVDPFQSSTIYGGGGAGVFRSNDGGTTFVSGSAVPASQIVTDSLHAGRLYVATPSSGVQTSPDGGTTWSDFNNGLPVSEISIAPYELALDAFRGYLYAAAFPGVFVYQFPLSSCTADPHTLCLNEGRFSVTADFQTPEGASTPATAVPLTSDTGYFWFFDPANVEIVTKVLNGCATNGHYWFFAGGLTNVGVQLQVKDAFTGAEQDYSYPGGTAFAPIQDTAAFSTCP